MTSAWEALLIACIHYKLAQYKGDEYYDDNKSYHNAYIISADSRCKEILKELR